MNGLEKVDLISNIGRDLQTRMTFDEINIFLKTYNVSVVDNPFKTYSSKWSYVKEILADVSEDKVSKIAIDLGIDIPNSNQLLGLEPDDVTFWEPNHFRLFISHLASYKEKIGALKIVLNEYGINAFVAHEDIEPTKEWQLEIEKALYSMDALCAVLMQGFKESNWTDQEVGVAVGRDVLIIPVRNGIDPYGFIGKYQGFQAKGKSVREVGKAIFDILCTNTKTRSKMIRKICGLFLSSPDASIAYSRLRIIEGIKDLSKEAVTYLRAGVVKNKNLDVKSLRYDFNRFIKKYDLEPVAFEEFEEQVDELKFSDDLPF